MIGDLFRKAWELYKRDVWMLIAAGFTVALIFGGAAAAVGLAVYAVAKSVIHTDSTGTVTTTNLSTAFGAAMVAVIVGVTLASIVALVFSGGMYEMVVGAEREQRPARLGDLFSGFGHFGSYAMLWLCQVGIVLGVELVCFLALRVLGVLALPVLLAGFVVMVWVSVSWIYGVVLIADRGLGGVEALRESLRMVKAVGWWSTFGALAVVGVLFFVVALVINLVTGHAAGVHALVIAIFYMFSFPFSICYVAAMYLGSSSMAAFADRQRFTPQPGAPAGGASSAPLPPAPPAPGGYQPAVAPAANADAWKAAADPLAAFPVQSLHTSKSTDPGRGVPRQAAPRKTAAKPEPEAPQAPRSSDPGRGVPRQAAPRTAPAKPAPEAPKAPEAPQAPA